MFIKIGDIVQVAVPQPINSGLLTYEVSQELQIGSFVEVPISTRRSVGVVWSVGSTNLNRKKVKKIIRVLETIPMNRELKNFLDRVSDYTVNPLNKVLKLSLGAQNFLAKKRTKRLYFLGDKNSTKMSAKQLRVIEFLNSNIDKSYSMSAIREALDVSEAVVKRLAAKGDINFHEKCENSEFGLCTPIFSKNLSNEQLKVSKDLQKFMNSEKFRAILLNGVTGSGKTEVYLDAVSETINLGKQVLILVPEIVLSIEFLERVSKRFGPYPKQWHSGISTKERNQLYHAVASSKVNLVIGARSALFLPFENLGLIVVDEEHDSSYKQDEGVCYNARDMAVLRASLSGAKVVLASATPSLESWVNSKTGKYDILDLRSRYGEATLPKIEIIDLRENNIEKGNFISKPLENEIKARIKKAEQSLLFLNRRGYAPITVCNACGFQIGCRNCDTKLVFHKVVNKLICHQCGDSTRVPMVCPNCLVEGELRAVGPGIERLKEECMRKFPTVKIGILSSDNTDDICHLRKKFAEFKSGEINIIIGTQLVSKGHNFPRITLVGVIDADLGLHGGDLRAAEKTFQSLRQVSGRAGRDILAGKALIQTYNPAHPVILALSNGSDDDFRNLELQARKSVGSPPYGRLVALNLSSTDEKELFDFGRVLVSLWQRMGFSGTRIYGPSYAPISKIRRRLRVRLLIKAEKNKNIQGMLRLLIEKVIVPRSVRMTVDVDPQNFY